VTETVKQQMTMNYTNS